jgi:hypothetical protein
MCEESKQKREVVIPMGMRNPYFSGPFYEMTFGACFLKKEYVYFIQYTVYIF